MKKTLLQSLTNESLQNILIGGSITMMLLSFFEPASWLMFIGLVLVAPLVFGYGWAAFIDRMDDSVQFAIEMSKKAHMVIGLAFSVLIGMVWAVVGTRVPVFPLNPITNAIFMLVAPKVVFLLWGFATTAFGYWWAWKTIVPNTSRGHQ